MDVREEVQGVEQTKRTNKQSEQTNKKRERGRRWLNGFVFEQREGGVGYHQPTGSAKQGSNH